jgi:hypothetical protein
VEATDQMIAMSRKRGYSAATIMLTAVVMTISSRRITGNSSQVHIGVTPKARMKMNTTIRLSARLNRLVRTTASGITRRGNCVLRTTPSWPTIEVTAMPVASWKNPKSTMLNSSSTG